MARVTAITALFSPVIPLLLPKALDVIARSKKNALPFLWCP
ncbi:Hypothetical protein, putative [Bodo saltans]|uniref:Uncharacterized protein n=1 Tax=Bodo saltans TaxID=75058 RepID=A0A0S4JAV5_BODSA|nr:Hypothetical protein, putative [Bodo saltans]|eukprot:CUG87136.1 Hypothetical protein, putative [Bodo saltans]